MGYWTLTKDCLYQLRNNWINYFHDRVDAIKYLCDNAAEDYRNEGNEDIRLGRYNTRSVHELYNDKLRQDAKWEEECLDKLKEENTRFHELWNEAESDVFTKDDYGYIIIYDFYRFEKRREVCTDLDCKTFRVRFSGQTHWYKLAGRRKDLEFKTGKPEFKYHEY